MCQLALGKSFKKVLFSIDEDNIPIKRQQEKFCCLFSQDDIPGRASPGSHNIEQRRVVYSEKKLCRKGGRVNAELSAPGHVWADGKLWLRN